MTAQEAAGRAHQELRDARIAKASNEVIDELQANFDACREIEIAAIKAWKEGR